MSPIAIVLGVLGLATAAIVGAVFWFVRQPTDRGEVSTQWRDERLRGRRD